MKIVNSSVDLAKIVLTVENIPIPDTYGEIVRSLSLIPIFNKAIIEKTAKWIRLRNIISHETLDIRWASIKKFTTESSDVYFIFLDRLRAYLKENGPEKDEPFKE